MENTDQYLSEDLADWLDAANSDVPDDLQEATKQLEATKVGHCTVYNWTENKFWTEWLN